MCYILNKLSYIRGPLVTFYGFFHTLFFSLVVIVIAVLTGANRRIIDILCVWPWSRFILFFAGVTLEIRGAENVRSSGKGFLILFNHSSYLDIPVLFYFPRSFNFGAKVELFKIPFFGRAMAMCGVLPIDRGNREKVMQVYDNAIRRVENGECFALAPEGTRQYQARIGPFKRGPFEFALNAKMDIMPVVLAGVFEVLPKRAIWVNMGRWRRKVIMEILPPIPTRDVTPEQLDALIQKMRSEVDAVFLRNHAEVTALV